MSVPAIVPSTESGSDTRRTCSPKQPSDRQTNPSIVNNTFSSGDRTRDSQYDVRCDAGHDVVGPSPEDESESDGTNDGVPTGAHEQTGAITDGGVGSGVIVVVLDSEPG